VWRHYSTDWTGRLWCTVNQILVGDSADNKSNLIWFGRISIWFDSIWFTSSSVVAAGGQMTVLNFRLSKNYENIFLPENVRPKCKLRGWENSGAWSLLLKICNFLSEFFQKFAVSVEELLLPALLLFWLSYDAAVHQKFEPFLNSELQFGPVLFIIVQLKVLSKKSHVTEERVNISDHWLCVYGSLWQCDSGVILIESCVQRECARAVSAN